jgi:hypothetical protein
MAFTRVPGQVESAMWIAILALQALPYAAALACTALSRIPELASEPPVTEGGVRGALRALPARARQRIDDRN